jgi:hypothetical protein
MKSDFAKSRGGNMKRLILLIAALAVAVMGSLDATPTAALANPIGSATSAGIFLSRISTAETARQEVQQDVLTRYGIIVTDRTALWSMDELISVRACLDAIAAKVTVSVGRDATPILKELLHGAVFYRDRVTDRIAYTLSGVVYVYDLWTTYDQTGRTFYLTHEIGHLLDTRTSLFHWFMGEVSTEFARKVGAYTDRQGQYQLGESFPHHDAPRNIRHRSDSASEDWAESFATVVVPEFEVNLRDIGAVRQAGVQSYLIEWSYTQVPVVLTTTGPRVVKAQPLANPISQASAAVPPVTIRILHIWKQPQGGALREFRDESVGTIIAPDLILTHNHYSRPQATWLEETYFFEDVWGRSVRWQPRSLKLTPLDAGTMLIRLPAGAFPDRATVADRTTVSRLAVGAWLTITYWDNVTRQMLSHDFQIVQIKDGLATLADPGKHINRGDSGGGAFWQGRLIGNTKSIYADGAGHALGIVNVTLVPTRVTQP